MRSISSAFKTALVNDHRAYLEYADFVLTDSTELHLTGADFWQNGFSIEDAVSSGGKFQLGSAIINKATLVLNNIYEEYDEYEFYGAIVTLSIGLELNGAVEKIQLGKYTVVEHPTYNGSLITIEMYDNMWKFDRPYNESDRQTPDPLVYPATLDTIVRDACTKCGLTLITTDFPNKSFVVSERPDDEKLTFREVLAYAAQIAGCYARCNQNGYLTLQWFNQSALTSARTTDNVSGVHYINQLYSKRFSTDDVVITGVRVSIQVEREVQEQGHDYTTTTYEEVEYLYGSTGYVISVEDNPLIAEDQVQTVATYLGTRINGFAFRTADVSHGSDPSIEAGDVMLCIDVKNKRYPMLVSSTKFHVGNAQKTQSIAEDPVRNTSARYTAETKNYVETRKLLAAEKTDRERITQDLADRIDNAQGLFETQVTDVGGGVITYLHDKPLLEDSDIQIKISTVGVTVTPNGTAEIPTWYGLTVDGQLIANILTTSGINADWINTGQLVIRSGGTEIFFADVDTGVVRISGNAITITAGDYLDTTITNTARTSTRTVLDNAQAYGLGCKVNYTAFSTVGNGSCYYHGYSTLGNATDADGWVQWNGEKVTIPKGQHMKPGSTMPFGATLYSVFRKSDSSWHDVTWIEATNTWEANTYNGSTPSARSTWTWNEANDIILASYSISAANASIKDAKLFTPPKKYSELAEVASGKAKLYTDTELSSFATTVMGEIDHIEDQLDGIVDTYYYPYEPTTSNVPANEWTTEELRSDHEGDIFLDTSTGKSYRWVKENNVWLWKEIPDTASAQALLAAQHAQDTADGKRRVFVVQPTPPYDAGDLWMQGSTGDILTCTTARAEGNYIATDWSKLNKYTDDSATSALAIRVGTLEDETVAYYMSVSQAAIVKKVDGTYNPAALTVSAKAQQIAEEMAAYSGRFVIETKASASASWETQYTSSADESSYTYTIPSGIAAIRCSLYKAGGTTNLLDQQTVPIVSDGANGEDAKGIAEMIPYYLATNRSTGVTVDDPGWSRDMQEMTAENKYLWVYYVNRYGEGASAPELITVTGEVANFSYTGDPAPLESLIADIEPTQDMHGYERPWAGGAGKNKLLINAETQTKNGVTFTVNSDGTIALSGTSTSSSNIDFKITDTLEIGQETILNGCPSGGSNSTYRLSALGGYTDIGSGCVLPADFSGYVYIRVFPGANVDNVLFKPMLRLSSDTDASFEPYENLCPVEGHTEANVQTHGKNLLPNVKYLTANRRNIILGNNASYSQQATYLKANVNYTLQVVGTQLFTVYLRDANNVATRIGGAYDTSFEITFTVGKSGYYAIYAYTSSSGYDEFVSVDSIEWFQLEVGNNATEYEEYTDKDFPVTFPSEAGAVYGGHIDLINGKLTADTMKLTVGDSIKAASANLGWATGTNANRIGIPIKTSIMPISGSPSGTVISDGEVCNIGEMSTAAGGSSGETFEECAWQLYRGASYWYFRYCVPISVTTAEDAYQWLQTNGCEFTAPTFAATDYTITPQQIFALQGVNNIFADTGDVTVKYYNGQTVGTPYITGVYGEDGTAGIDGLDANIWTATANAVTPNYTFNIADLTGGTGTPRVGDIVLRSYYRYTITSVGETTVLTGQRTSIRGAAGAAGTNNATVTLYQRGTTAPAKPSGDLTYTFETGVLSGETLGNWSQRIPSGTDPVWAIAATASATTATDTIGTGEWSDQVKILENGENGQSGYNQATIYLYQRASSAPSKPSSTVTYTFSTGDLDTVPTGWFRTIPNGDNPCYVTSAAAISNGSTCQITSEKWSAVVKLVEDGSDGDDGADAYTVLLTNESHTFAGGTSAATAGSTSTEVVGYKGATRVATTVGEITGIPAAGMTVTVNNNGTTSTTISIAVTTSMSTKQGTLTIPVTIDGKLFNLIFSFAIALKGSTGSRGATWYTGTGITGKSTTPTVYPNSGVSSAIVGDHYLNTSTQDVYVCTLAGNASTAQWKYEQNIKGTEGTPGTAGTNAYLHVKYSNDGGQTFTGNTGEDPGDWIGTYTDSTQADSTTPSDYTWAKIKGNDGENGEDAFFLETPFTWVNNGTRAEFEAVIYKGDTIVTDEYPNAWFEWFLRNEDGENRIAIGKTCSVAKSSLGYGSTITCIFTTSENRNAQLLTRSGKGLLTRSGLKATTFLQADGDQKITELPYKTSPEMYPNDYIMGIDAADGYQASMADLADYVLTNSFSTRNLMTYPYSDQSRVESGVTYVDNEDGSITVSGTATANTTFEFRASNAHFMLSPGSYFINQPSDASQSTCRFRIDGYKQGVYVKSYVAGASKHITILEDDDIDSLECVLIVYAEYNMNNVTFTPQIYSEVPYVSARQAIGNRLYRYGDTMEGSALHLRSYNISDSIPQSTTGGQCYLGFRNANNHVIGWVQSQMTADGYSVINLYSRFPNASQYAYVKLGVTEDGTQWVSVSSAAAWRNAIGTINKAGDTMTGNLHIQKTSPQTVYYSTDIDLAVGQTIPSAATLVGGFQVNDKQNWNSGWFRIYKNENDLAFAQMSLRRSVSGSTVMNSLTIGVNPDGTRYVSVSESATWRSALGAVYKGGDTMTGALTRSTGNTSGMAIRNTNMTRETTPSAYQEGGQFRFEDKNGNALAYIQGFINTSGANGFRVLAWRNVNGTSTYNGLTIGVNADGSANIGLSANATGAAAAWRNAIGALSTGGGTVTGNIDRKATNVDASKANNNVTSAQYPTIGQVLDNANRILVRHEAVIETGGAIAAYWYVRNYNTAGEPTGQKGIRMSMNKSGTMTYTVSDPANFRSAIGAAASGSSSIRYKHDIRKMSDDELDAHRLYALEAKQFIFNDDFDRLQYDDMRGKVLPGFIAEDVAEVYPSAVIHKDGQVENWDERRLIPAMLQLIQEQHEEIRKLKQVIHVV